MTQAAPPRFELRPLVEADAAELHALIEANRRRLQPWLAWAATQTFDDTLGFIQGAAAQEARDDGYQRAIAVEGEIAGVIGFTGVDWSEGSTRIGYWLAEAHEGRGLMSEAVRAMLGRAFGELRLSRVEIRAAAENRRSRAIPERLGFRQVGYLPAAERVDGRDLDSVVYSIAAAEWSG